MLEDNTLKTFKSRNVFIINLKDFKRITYFKWLNAVANTMYRNYTSSSTSFRKS